MKIGYARVSTKQQNLDRQLIALEAEGCELIYSEKASGKDARQRPQLQKAISALQENDILIVAEWDRATRSYTDGLQIIAEIGKRQAMIKVLDRDYLDLTTPMGKAMLGIWSAIAEDDRQRRLTQARDGRERAKERGVHLGRKAALTPQQQAEAIKMRVEGKSLKEVAGVFNVSKSTISRLG